MPMQADVARGLFTPLRMAPLDLAGRLIKSNSRDTRDT